MPPVCFYTDLRSKETPMTATAPRSWDDVAALQVLAAAGDEDAEFYLENAVLWQFPWEHDLISTRFIAF